MKASRRVLARHIARQLVEGASSKVVVKQLAAYIIEHRLHGQLELIVADIAKNLTDYGVVLADVTSVRPLTDELRAGVIAYVKQLENSKNVEVVEHIDKALLGGVIIETPHRRYDASIASRLKRLRNA